VEHLEHFGLSRDPFSNDPQLSVYFASAEHASAERRLRRGVTQQKGLCLLTGPEGAGKSMVVRHLLDSLEEEVYQACLLVPVPGVADVTWVLSRFAAHLGVQQPAPERAALLAQIYEQMAVVREDGRHAVLIIDESDVLAERGALGDLRALLNLEYEERRLLTLVLVGPNEIQDTLARDSGLASRVDVHVRLRPLDADAATQYMTHRIRRVGGSPAILDGSALAALIERAGGIPRRLNTIADNALFEAYLSGRVSATRDDVLRAADELEMGEGARTPAPAVRPAAAPPASRRDAAGARPAAGARRGPSAPAQDLDSVFDSPPPPRRSPPRGADVTTLLSSEPELDEVVAAPTPPPRVRGASKAAAAFSGRGAPDKTMMLGHGESLDLDSDGDGFEARTLAIPVPSGPPKDEEIEDLFADIVEEG
jgi:type II secretory pathway predicted ATPase ExeA